MATAQSPNDLTRQQLDELDALLQKMLALPLNAPDSSLPNASPTTSRPKVSELPLPEMPAAPPRSSTPTVYGPSSPPVNGRENTPTVWKGDSPSGPVIAPQLLAIPAASDPLPPPPMTRKAPSSHPRSVDTGAFSVQGLAKVDLPADSTSPSREPNERESVILASSSAPPSDPEPAKRMVFVPPALVPLIAFNRASNVVLGRLGLIGRFLRTGFGKNLFAFAAVVLLAFTMVKIAQKLGWIALSNAPSWLM